MKSYIRKSISIILITVIMLALTISSVSANSKVIYESSSKEIITSGAVLERITRFTDDGWLSINVLRVDLSNPNINVDTMSNADSLRKLTSTKSLAQSRGAVAAINGGFFNWSSESGMANPIGPVVESGSIISAETDFNRYNDNMASLSISKMNKALYDYWKTDITLIAPDGSTLRVARYNKNKPNPEFKEAIILDRRWGEKSIGTDMLGGCPDILEMVVDGGKVTQIREGQPAIQIPVNGYVVVTRLDSADFIRKKFKVGDIAAFNITTTPDWNRLKTAVTGGALLLKDGKIPEKFSHIPEGTSSTRNPRTAIGSTRDGRQLFFVTVDGRQNASIGMTMTELAQLMSELGVYNALNLDGGGSTTMVARPLGNTDLNTVNRPSDGSARRITTAVGVFSIAPPSELEGLTIDTEDNNVFVGTSRAYTVRGYDRYFNPIIIDPSQVKWSVSGIQGTFKDNIFYPSSVGSGKVIATVGTVTSKIEVNSLSSPVQLMLSKSTVKLPLNSTFNLKVNGKNKNGYYAVINPDDVSWTAKGNIGKFDRSTFTASGQGTGYIDAAIGKTHAYCTVSVAAESNSLTDKFEKENGSFLSYPATVTGSYKISTEQKHSGSSSGKLSYDFTSELGDTRAAYFALANNGLSLAKNTTKIGLWVYNNHPNTNWLRGEVYDDKGSKYLIDFVKELDWSGWKYVEMPLQGITSPAKLTRIYLAQIHPVSDSGCVYFDDLTVTTSTYPSIDMAKIPQDTVPVDEANKHTLYVKSNNSFRFAVFGQTVEPGNLLESMIARKFTDKANKYIDAAAIVGSGVHSMQSDIEKPVIATNTGYRSFDMIDSRFIQLDISKKGLRSTDPDQWRWLLDQLNTAPGSNVFIFLTDSPKTFSDGMEAKLFQDILTKYKQEKRKNIWVFYESDKNSSYMERGIRYITTAGYNVAGLTPKNTDAANYVLVTVKDGSVTFEFKPVI